MAGTLIGTYKTELIRRRQQWRGLEDLELATSGWVSWFNTERLHAALCYRTLTDVEAEHYRSHPPRETAA